jgi:hypothetical protein
VGPVLLGLPALQDSQFALPVPLDRTLQQGMGLVLPVVQDTTLHPLLLAAQLAQPGHMQLRHLAPVLLVPLGLTLLALLAPVLCALEGSILRTQLMRV